MMNCEIFCNFNVLCKNNRICDIFFFRLFGTAPVVQFVERSVIAFRSGLRPHVEGRRFIYAVP